MKPVITSSNLQMGDPSEWQYSVNEVTSTWSISFPQRGNVIGMTIRDLPLNLARLPSYELHNLGINKTTRKDLITKILASPLYPDELKKYIVN